jgi:hypothetical protein
MRLHPLSIAVIVLATVLPLLPAATLGLSNPGFEANVLANPSQSGPDNFIGRRPGYHTDDCARVDIRCWNEPRFVYRLRRSLRFGDAEPRA